MVETNNCVRRAVLSSYFLLRQVFAHSLPTVMWSVRSHAICRSKKAICSTGNLFFSVRTMQVSAACSLEVTGC